MKCILATGALGIISWSLLAPAPAAARTRAPSSQDQNLRVGVAGSEPFVVQKGRSLQGISVEVWQALAAQTGWRYRFQTYADVPDALAALASGKLDVVVGPVSITAERALRAHFSQPYFASSLSIASRAESLSLWQRLAPFFNSGFYYALGVLLCVLAFVGTAVWLAERHAVDTQFPHSFRRGVASGIYFAVVTMSTVGYGDLAPKTRLGRLVTGIWIIISIVAASSLVAGIASALTLTGLQSSAISSASQLSRKTVAVLAGSPGQEFAQSYHAVLRRVDSLQAGYDLLKSGKVDALVFDRPQLSYFMQQQHDSTLAVASAQYMRQNYGFAVPISSPLLHRLNLSLLTLEESGRVYRIVREWLGNEE